MADFDFFSWDACRFVGAERESQQAAISLHVQLDRAGTILASIVFLRSLHDQMLRVEARPVQATMRNVELAIFLSENSRGKGGESVEEELPRFLLLAAILILAKDRDLAIRVLLAVGLESGEKTAAVRNGSAAFFLPLDQLGADENS